MSSLKRCPNCGVEAISMEKIGKNKPNEIMECNNCHTKFKRIDLLKKLLT